ncbi:MAG: hypothetical protein GY788_21075 [bacterium]|nr:hypothetical protein [bacterium]
MATTIAFGSEELSTTGLAYLESRRSMRFRPERMLQCLLDERENEEGGERVIIPWSDINEHSTTTQLTTGYEPVNLTGVPIHEAGNDKWAYVVRPVMISTRDDITNRGSRKIIDRLKSRIDNVHGGLMQQVNTHLCAGDQTAVNDFNHLNGFDDTAGFIEENAVASQTNTVHGVAKSAYATLRGFQNQVFDLDTSFSSNGLRGLYNTTTKLMDQVPDAVSKIKLFASEAGQNNLKRALNSNERYLSEKELDGGRRVLVYNGIPIISEPRLPNAGSVTTGDPWTFFMMDADAVKFVGQTGWVMEMDEFRPVSGHVARVAFLHLFGQLTIRDWGTSAILWDGETW